MRHAHFVLPENASEILSETGADDAGRSGRSLAGTATSSPAEGIDLSLASVVCCQRSLRRADPSFRGVLPTMACHCV